MAGVSSGKVYGVQIMVKRLQIKNFQSHKDSALSFSEGVNIIIGGTDCGKSSIIRALKWLIKNRPGGDEFRSVWGGGTEVILELEDGTITRSKDKNENSYKLNSSVFSDFGVNTPKEITDVLNIDDINIQFQLDRPFLLMDTPGEVAHHFNRIAHLEPVDVGMKNVSIWINSLTSQIGKKAEKGKPSSGLIGEQEKWEEELKSFEFLETFEIELEVLEGVHNQMIQSITNQTKLKGVIKKLKDTENELQNLSFIDEIDTQLSGLLSKHKEWKGLRQDQSDLLDVIENLKLINVKTARLKNILSLEDMTGQLLKVFENKKEQEIIIKRFKGIITSLKTVEKEYKTIKATEKELSKRFEDSFPDVCPLCGKPK